MELKKSLCKQALFLIQKNIQQSVEFYAIGMEISMVVPMPTSE